jgi:hypothetical protein
MLGAHLYTGAIKVNTNKPPGIYSVKVVGTLPGLTTTKSEIFIITINTPNQLPYFSSPLSAQSVALIGTITVTPSMLDPDACDTVTISAVKN